MSYRSRSEGPASPARTIGWPGPRSTRNSLPSNDVTAVPPRHTITSGSRRSRRSATACTPRCAPISGVAVLLDLRLGSSNSFSLCTELRELVLDVSIVTFTAFGNEGLLDQAITAGAVGYVPKGHLDRGCPRCCERYGAKGATSTRVWPTRP
jgi:hypothetical protein